MSVDGEHEGDVVLRDLQSILRKSIDDQVIVVNYKTKNLLPKGENYGSTMLKVDAVIKRSNKSKEEDLPLVAKMVPVTEFQKSVLNLTASFGKEMYVFEKIVPTYRELEIEAGVKEDDLIDIIPKYYGGRLSRDATKLNNADEDAVLLLENLKARGYDTRNRMTGLDIDHAKMAISELARFHALGMIFKHKRPELFESSKETMNVVPFDMKNEEFNDIFNHTLEAICKDSRIAKYKDRIKATLGDWESFTRVEMVEPWVTIIHGDFWVNNIMFREENGKPTDIKFIDFQITRYSSPCKDIPYFLCASTSPEVLENHFDELLDMYHEKFIEVLEQSKIDVSPFSKKNFEEQLRKDANNELFHCVMALKFFTLEVQDDFDLNDLKSNVMMSKSSNTYIERAWQIVSKFIEKNWI